MDNKFMKKLDNADYVYLRLDVLRSILDRDDAKEIVKEIFPALTKRDYLASISPYLLEFLIINREYFSDEILYLLKGDYVSKRDLTTHNIEAIIDGVPEAIDVIVEQFNDIYLDNSRFDTFNLKSQTLISSLTTYIINNRSDLFETFMKAVIHIGIPETIQRFFVVLVSNDQNFDYNLILRALRNCKKNEADKNFSNLPYILVDYVHWSDDLKEFLTMNFEELFAYEKDKKVKFLFAMRNLIPKDVLAKYSYLLKISYASVYREDNEALNILLEHGEEGFIKDYIGTNEVTIFNERMGSTSEVFKIGEKGILKLEQEKYDKESEKEHFLLAPTQFLVISDDKEKEILYVEKQKLHLQVHNGVPLNKEDLDNFFEELDKCGLEINDPHCIAREFDNFGFLDDYHEATLVGVNSHEELPEWFKKRPVVLFDIDMVRKKKGYEKRKLV
ncbi:MAG: hypothetical protein OSJ70_04110 [Bacilli bacterium]|nr:hypothetical protein [Bacilli bacterium]